MRSNIFLLALLLLGGGCSQIPDPNDDTNATESSWFKPSLLATWQIQLQDDLNLSYNADLYDIDLFDTPSDTIEKLHAEGKKVICYFSAGSYEEWREDSKSFNEILLGFNLDDWEGEKWLDISNDALKPIMLKRLDLAKDKGCDGVDPDNMNGYTQNSGFTLSQNDQLAYNKFIAEESHKRGLSVGLKNDLDQIKDLEPYFDFAVNEQCYFYNECDLLQPFLNASKAVLNIEYNEMYVNNTNNQQEIICKQSNENNIQTLILPLKLDDSFRIDCQ